MHHRDSCIIIVSIIIICIIIVCIIIICIIIVTHVRQEWGERRAPPTEEEPSGRFLSCWAEKNGNNGYGDRWHDGWGEDICPMSGRGSKRCNKWKKYGNGKEVSSF